MNTGLVIEVLLSSLVISYVVSLALFHYISLATLLLNERENERILGALVMSDRYISREIALLRLDTYTNNLVDCNLLQPETNLYLRCGGVSYGSPAGKLIVRRLVVDVNKPTVFEVGLP